MTAVSVPRFFKLQSFEERGYYDEVMSAIRYAHKTAMATGCDYKVSVTSAGYEIRKRRDCSSGVFDLFNHPATSSPNGYNENTPSGIDITGNLDFYYDNNGQPNNFSDNPINKTTNFQLASGTLAGFNIKVTCDNYGGFQESSNNYEVDFITVEANKGSGNDYVYRKITATISTGNTL